MKKCWLISLFVITGCVTKPKPVVVSEVSAQPPKGFAELQENLGPDEVLRAVSFTGVTYRVRKIPNEEKAKLTFWRESFEKHLTDSGYIFQKRKRVKRKGGPKGAHVTFIAPTGTADYRYSFSMIVNDDWIVIAEAAGMADDYEPVAKSLRYAAKKITL